MKLNIKKNDQLKYESIIFFIVAVIIWLILVTNYQNTDYEGYYIMYNNPSLKYWLNPGYLFLEQLGNRLSINFYWFRFIFVSVPYFIVVKYIYKKSECPVIVLIAYSFFPFLLDCVQIRNFFAYGLIVYGLRYLDDINRKNVIKYILIVALASLFHFTAFFYLLLIIVPFWEEKKIFKISMFSSVAFIIIILIATVMFKNVGNIIYNITGRTVNLDISSVMIGLEWTIAGIMLDLFIFYNREKIVNNSNLVKVAYLSVLYLPLMFFTFDLYRLYRNLIIINYIVLFVPTKQFKVKYSTLVAIVYVAILFYIQLSPHNSIQFESVTRTIIENNYFLKSLGM